MILNSESVSIVIPVYKNFDRLSSKELISLEQVFRLFTKATIYFVGPASLNTSGYRSFVEKRITLFRFKPFKDGYFANLQGYNELCMSKEFYGQFLQHKYMLLYQLDAFVFSNNIEEWCALGYDYMGAPWLKGWQHPEYPIQFIGAGNGGFSLRKTASFFRVCNHGLFGKWSRFRKWMNNYQRKHFDKKQPMYWRFLKKYIHIADQEDHFWAEDVPNHFKWFKVAPAEVALGFSFEVAPEELFKLNGSKLPFGCHGWDKFGLSFWDQYIDISPRQPKAVS